MSKIFQAPAIVKKITTLVDGGLSVMLHTQEMQSKDETRLFQYRNLPVWFLLKSEKFQKLPDLPEIKVEKNQKTPSERLRGVIFKYWEKRTSSTEDFDTFYRKQMENLIDAYKEKLD